MICKLCNKDKELVDAHIIPASFFRKIINGSETAIVISDKKDEYPTKRSPHGIYDSNILCNECEKKFSSWDNYAKNLILNSINKSKTIQINKSYGYSVIENYDYALLKLFFISLLWRASVSRHEFFKKVNLGPYEKKAKVLIESGNPGDSDCFSVIILKYENPLSSIIMDPYTIKIYQLNFYCFFLLNISAYIKVDQRKLTPEIREFALSSKKPLIVLKGEYFNSPNFRVATNLVVKNIENERKWKISHKKM